jgi:hypothetical protein
MIRIMYVFLFCLLKIVGIIISISEIADAVFIFISHIFIGMIIIVVLLFLLSLYWCLNGISCLYFFSLCLYVLVLLLFTYLKLATGLLS